MPVAHSQIRVKREIDVSFAQMDQVRPILKKALSPTGKFVMLPSKGAVLVIDDAANIAAAERALAGALPKPNVQLAFAFQTGLPSRRTRIEFGREVFFPTAWEPGQIPNVVRGPGPYPVTPAHPTGFQKRLIGTTSDTITTDNGDGTVTLSVNMENTSFDGFINYGSPINLVGGQIGTVPVAGQVGDPTFFQPFIENRILMPIISTTRISTTVVIRPRVKQGVVNLDMMPRLSVYTGEGAEVDIDLNQFSTIVPVGNNGVGRIFGFQNASEDFNRHFLNAEHPKQGSVAISVKANISAGAPVPAPIVDAQ